MATWYGKDICFKGEGIKCATYYHPNQILYVSLTTLSHNHLSGVMFQYHNSVIDRIAEMEFNSFPRKEETQKIRQDQEDICKALICFLRDNHCDHLFIDK